MTGYTPRPYCDLLARSLVLAAGIEKFTPLLPHRSDYSDGRPPCVKWIFLPNRRGDLNDWENNVENCYFRLDEIYNELKPHLEFLRAGFSNMEELYGTAFWVWEDVRPSVNWLNARLPLIYFMARTCDCNLEGWTYEDDHAWDFGLSNIIKEAGFDPSYTRPGQMS